MEKWTLSTIYSQPSIEEAKKLIDTFLETFGILTLKADDLFYYGVFCSVNNYASYDWHQLYMIGNVQFEIPPVFISVCSTIKEKVNYVKMAINEVLRGEIKKPEWMTFIEMETDNGYCSSQPSNFLRLLPKEEKYKKLGEQLIQYLYSPNRTSVVY